MAKASNSKFVISGIVAAGAAVGLIILFCILGSESHFQKVHDDYLKTSSKSLAKEIIGKDLTPVPQSVAVTQQIPQSSTSTNAPTSTTIQVPLNAPKPEIEVVVENKKDEVSAIPKGSAFEKKEEVKSVPVSKEPPKAEHRDVLREIVIGESPNIEVPNEALNRGRLNTQSESGEQAMRAATTITPGRYLFRNTTEGARSNSPMNSSSDTGPGINVQTFAPRGGHPVTLVLAQNLTSNSLEQTVEAYVWLPYEWNGRVILNRGDKILGKATAGNNRNRILVTYDSILLKDGRSLPIKGTAQNIDGTLGIPGYKVGNEILAAIGPILADFVVGASQAVTSQNTSVTTFDGATTYTTGDNGGKIVNLAYAGAGKAFERLRDIMLSNLDEEKPYILCTAGTKHQMFLDQYIDLSLADYGK